MRLPVLAILACALAACSQSETDAAPPPPVTPSAPVVIGGVDLSRPIRVLGTEPFWAIEIADRALVMTRPDAPELRAGASAPVVTGTTAVLTGATEVGDALVVTLIATECSDGMSDRLYRLTAKVERGPETLNGCAETVEVLSRQPSP